MNRNKNRIKELFVLLMIGMVLTSFNNSSIIFEELNPEFNEYYNNLQEPLTSQESTIQQEWSYLTSNPVSSVDISSDGEYIIAGNINGDIILLNKSSSTPMWTYNAGERVGTVSISSDGTYIAAGSEDNHLYVFNKSSNIPLWDIVYINDFNSVKISSDGKFIAAGTENNYVYLFSTLDPTPLWSYRTGGKVKSVAISSNGSFIVSGGDNDIVNLFKQGSPIPFWQYDVGADVRAVDISANGEYVVAGSVNDNFYAFHRSAPTVLWNVVTNGEVNALSISSDGNYIIAGSALGGAYLHSISNTEIWKKEDFGLGVNAVAISADGHYIGAGCDDGNIYIYNQSSPTELWSFPMGGPVDTIALSYDGQYIVSDGTNNVNLFKQYYPNGPLSLSSNADNPDMNGMFHLNWSESIRALNYSIYSHNNFISEINGTVNLLDKGLVNQSYAITGLNDGDYYYAVMAFNEYYNSTSNCVSITVDLPNSIADFDVIENASYNKYETGFRANENNNFNVSVPDDWNAESWELNISSYVKEQQINDTTFDIIEGDSPWTNEKNTLGFGQFINSWQPTASNPEFVRTSMFSIIDGGFNQGDYSYWGQTLDNVSNIKEIERGKIFQEEDETAMNWDFTEIPTKFSQDLGCPYGGEYNPPYDQMLLGQTGGSLYIYIEPDDGASGRNPSASWNHYVDLPYKVDFAQITISWEVDEISSFEVSDEYQVSARVNSDYISGSDLISRNDSLPYLGSDEALIVYNIAQHLDHGIIERTYNITRHLNDRTGVNTFDFGVWAKNPTHLGDTDLIFAKFHSIEIKYNTSNKYEVAEFEFDYKVTDNQNYGYNLFTENGIGSLILVLDNSSKEETIRIIDCSKIDIHGADDGLISSSHISLSLPHEYTEFLTTGNLDFKFGILIEDQLNTKISYIFDYDNVSFSVNYKHDNVSYSGLQNNIDDTGWNNMSSSYLNIDTSVWIEGEIHNIKFRSNRSEFQTSLFLNFNTNFKVNTTLGVPKGAWAVYKMDSIGDEYGLWNVSYDNKDSYHRLEISPSFEVYDYSIGFINLPAFDSKKANSENWDVFNAISPDLVNVSQVNLIRFNYSLELTNQSARIEDAFKGGIWTLQARQPNYIINCTYNTTEEYTGLPSYFTNQFLEYNFSLIEDNPINGNYSIIVYNSNMSILGSYPKYISSSTDPVIGNIDLSVGFELGQYYLSIEWNDTSTTHNKTLRFGSIKTQFYVLNGTDAAIYVSTASVQVGDNASFEIYYRTSIGNFGILNPNITVYDNTTGTPELWGVLWKGEYQAYITPLTEGNHSIELGTEGATQGNYSILIKCEKDVHQTQYLTFELNITTIGSFLEVNITIGAYLNATSHWVINSDNIPFVNDTTSSVLQLNLTDSGSGLGQPGGLVLGTIGGGITTFFAAVDIGGGLYNLTIDTTGKDATPEGGNVTMLIICSAGGYNSIIINVTIEIAKITTQLTLQNINPVYAEGQISIYALFENNETQNPYPNNYGNLTFYIDQGGAPLLVGSLNFIMFGLYTTDVALTGLAPSTYNVTVNSTARNCVDSISNTVLLTIEPQDSTQLDISINPVTIRILQQFEIEATLRYGNATAIPDQTIYFNLTITHSTEDNISFIVEGTTDINGKSTYNYIIAEAYKDGTLTINVTYYGQNNKQASKTGLEKTVYGRIPITINLTETPTFIRVGYSATYRGDISIDGESIAYRELFFIAWYNSEIPFLTQQIFTDGAGGFEYTISEISNGYKNLTVWIEHKKTTTVAYNFTFLKVGILPKWEVNFTYDTLPDIIRFGQDMNFNLQVRCSENNSLSFEGLSIIFTLSYGTTVEIYTKFIDDNNNLVFMYTVANSFQGKLNVSINFPGTVKYTSYDVNQTLDITAKIQVKLAFIEIPSSQYMAGENYFSISVTDDDGNPLDGLEIVFEILDEAGTVIYSSVATTDETGIAAVSINFEEVGNNFILRVRFIEEGIYSGIELTSENIRIVNEFILFLDLLPFLLIGVAITAAVAYTYYRGVVIPKKRRYRESLKKMYQRLFDVENIQHIIILTEGGIPCFNKSLSDIPIEETLVSGFLSAITSFGSEIGSKMKDVQPSGEFIDSLKTSSTRKELQEFSYQRFKIIMQEGTYIKTAVLLLKKPSMTLKTKTYLFTQEFERNFEDRVKNFKGEIFKEVEVDPLIERIFEADLLYPHRVIEKKVETYVTSISKKDLSRDILTAAKSDEFESSFYLRDMINYLKTNDIDEVAAFDSLETLKKEKIIFAINPRTNFLIEQLKPYTSLLDDEDRAVLFAIYDGNTTQGGIKKHVNKKQKVALSKDINYILKKFEKMKIITETNDLNNTGIAIATVLQLIPEL